MWDFAFGVEVDKPRKISAKERKTLTSRGISEADSLNFAIERAEIEGWRCQRVDDNRPSLFLTAKWRDEIMQKYRKEAF
ncbi:MAG: hypothetical protein BWY63_00451 [Chloroflexi bacterium ADurb.Bin360]|nr:MAG: hypothetical protein BWY63_00451 [Chloroflexi bacterium ADurb.Bin360]